MLQYTITDGTILVGTTLAGVVTDMAGTTLDGITLAGAVTDMVGTPLIMDGDSTALGHGVAIETTGILGTTHITVMVLDMEDITETDLIDTEIEIMHTTTLEEGTMQEIV